MTIGSRLELVGSSSGGSSTPGALPTATVATLPGSPSTGQAYYLTDVKKITYWSGTAWIVDGLLARAYVAPAVNGQYTSSSATYAAIDSTNLSATFVAPPSGVVKATFICTAVTNSSSGGINFALLTHGTTTAISAAAFLNAVVGNGQSMTAQFLVSGLTGGTSYHWDMGWQVAYTSGEVMAIYYGSGSGTGQFGIGPILSIEAAA